MTRPLATGIARQAGAVGRAVVEAAPGKLEAERTWRNG